MNAHHIRAGITATLGKLQHLLMQAAAKVFKMSQNLASYDATACGFTYG